MKLLRFACISLSGPARKFEAFNLEHGEASVTVRRSSVEGGVLLVARSEVPVDGKLESDSEGCVVVPDEPRRRAESAIEIAADLISIATGHRRHISSLSLVVSFRAENDEERVELRSHKALKGFEGARSFGRLSVHVAPEMVGNLSDRQDGVALLAEALAQSHMSGRFRELVP